MVCVTILKIEAFCTATLAVAVICASSWTLFSTFENNGIGNTKFENNTGITANGDEKAFQDHNDEKNETASNTVTQSAEKVESQTKFEKFWSKKTQKYKTLIQGSTGGSIFAGLVQLCLSWIIFCSNVKNIGQRAKLWHAANFMIFLILIVCIAVPMTFSHKKDSFIGITNFWKQFTAKLTNIVFEDIYSLNHKIFTENLHGYFLTLTINEVILFTFLTISCCCVCGCKENPYRSV